MTLRLVIAGGGTGGHLYPGIAVAREAIREGFEVLFIGTGRGIEARVLPREGLALAAIWAGKFKGMGAIGKARSMAMIPAGVLSSINVLRRFAPDAVLGVGGYASFPAVVAAKMMGLPVVIQEQNAYPGLANRLLGRVAGRVALGFREAEGFFPRGKTVFTGNPIRTELLSAGREASMEAFGMEPGRLTVLVFGGSAGAHRINSAVVDALGPLSGRKGGLQFIHQTGEKDFEAVEAGYRRQGYKARVMPFIFDMAGAYSSADLVVCRSGALTLAEVTALGKPAILIPYPHAANNHQEVNARALERSGAARVVLDGEATGEGLASEISGLINDEAALALMSSRCRLMGRPGAASEVVEIIRSVIGN